MLDKLERLFYITRAARDFVGDIVPAGDPFRFYFEPKNLKIPLKASGLLPPHTIPESFRRNVPASFRHRPGVLPGEREDLFVSFFSLKTNN